MGESAYNAQGRALHRFFEQAFKERLERSPQTLTQFGIKRHAGRLDDLSPGAQEAGHRLIEDQLRRLRGFDRGQLDAKDLLNYRVFELEAQSRIDQHRYHLHNYLINQKFGLHVDFPAFMVNMHLIDDNDDAENYIARLEAFDAACSQVIDGLEQREAIGVIPPRYLFPQFLGDCREFVGGSVEQNLLHRDFAAKLERAQEHMDPVRGEALLKETRNAITKAVIPGYRRLIRFLEDQQSRAPTEGGAWSLPDGEAYYRACLAHETSTTMDAEAVNRLGEQEVVRLQNEILALREDLGVKGDLQTLFSMARDDPRFFYPQSQQGRDDYLAEMNRVLAKMHDRLPELFHCLPQDPLIVQPVEPHREKTAGLAFYQGPSADGSRPGIFYLNLHDMQQLPSFVTEALAFHEGLPGHHMQFAIANRLDELPTFRRYAHHNAFVEGWGLYSEQVTRELDMYSDPWSDFGRLVQQLKRACRLVVDTGLHARRWTRQQAVDYLYQNMPSNHAQVVNEVDRYIIMPAQANAYTIGMLEMLEWRRDAQRIAGTSFDLQAFHDELLRHGPLPLELLREQVTHWARSLSRTA